MAEFSFLLSNVPTRMKLQIHANKHGSEIKPLNFRKFPDFQICHICVNLWLNLGLRTNRVCVNVKQLSLLGFRFSCQIAHFLTKNQLFALYGENNG